MRFSFESMCLLNCFISKESYPSSSPNTTGIINYVLLFSSSANIFSIFSVYLIAAFAALFLFFFPPVLVTYSHGATT